MLYMKFKTLPSQVQWSMPVVPTTQETEASCSCHQVNQMGWSGGWICILHTEGVAEIIMSPGGGHLSFLCYKFTAINFSSMLWVQWIPVMGHWMKEWVGTFHSYVLPTQWEVLQGQLAGAQYWDRRGKMQNVPSLQHNTAGPTLLDIWFTFR